MQYLQLGTLPPFTMNATKAWCHTPIVFKLVVCVLYIANQCRLFNTNVNICQECIYLINQIAVNTRYRAMLCKITSNKCPTSSLHLQISNLILLCYTWFTEPSDARLRRQTLPLLAQVMTACRVGGMDRNFTLCIPCATTLWNTTAAKQPRLFLWHHSKTKHSKVVQ